MKPFEIFRAGRHIDSLGRELSFSEADVRATAALYSPSIHEAPIVVGHPADDAPAYGWVKTLDYADGRLSASARQIDAGFSALVAQGRYKKISASFYMPGAPANPRPGCYYLRHVGFLGAQPPSVKGLKPVELAGGDHGVVTFSLAEADAGEIDAVELARLSTVYLNEMRAAGTDITLPQAVRAIAARHGVLSTDEG